MTEPPAIAQLIHASQDTVLLGGKTRKRRWRREGGGDVEREKMNERDRAQARGAITTKLQQSSLWNYSLPSLPVKPHGGPVPAQITKAKVSAREDGAFNKDQVEEENSTNSFCPASDNDNTNR